MDIKETKRGGFFAAIQDASFGQVLVWIFLIVAIVWGFAVTTVMVVAMLIALSVCVICITIMLGIARPMIPTRGKNSGK